jgi:hypothetical protein
MIQIASVFKNYDFGSFFETDKIDIGELLNLITIKELTNIYLILYKQNIIKKNRLAKELLEFFKCLETKTEKRKTGNSNKSDNFFKTIWENLNCIALNLALIGNFQNDISLEDALFFIDKYKEWKK